MEQLLPFLLLLICPIMMFFMMRGHGHNHKDHCDHKEKEKGGEHDHA